MKWVVALALTLGLAACSSSTDGTGAPPSTPSTPAPSSSAVAPSSSSSSSSAPAPSASTITVTSSPAAPSSSGAGGTAQTVARPVTAAGAPAPGWTVKSYPDSVSCSAASLSAVDPGIAFCAPAAAYAMACWPAADGGHVLCLLDPVARTLSRFALSGSFPSVTPPSDPTPFALVLSDGVGCRIRDGGTGTTLEQHPDWVAFYYCDHDLALYGPGSYDGVDTSHPTWTAYEARQDGQGEVTTRAVATAVFVGTAGA